MSGAKKLEQRVRKTRQLPENKTCFVCQDKGPIYACITYGTFVCTICGGIHREFGYRVKSISMATFTAEEVDKLESIGNKNATSIWLGRLDGRSRRPSSSNVGQIRKFIKQIFHDKKWYSEEGATAAQMEWSKREQSLPKAEPIEKILGSGAPRIRLGHRSGSSDRHRNRTNSNSRREAMTLGAPPAASSKVSKAPSPSSVQATAATTPAFGDFASFDASPAASASPSPASVAKEPAKSADPGSLESLLDWDAPLPKASAPSSSAAPPSALDAIFSSGSAAPLSPSGSGPFPPPSMMMNPSAPSVPHTAMPVGGGAAPPPGAMHAMTGGSGSSGSMLSPSSMSTGATHAPGIPGGAAAPAAPPMMAFPQLPTPPGFSTWPPAQQAAFLQQQQQMLMMHMAQLSGGGNPFASPRPATTAPPSMAPMGGHGAPSMAPMGGHGAPSMAPMGGHGAPSMAPMGGPPAGMVQAGTPSGLPGTPMGSAPLPNQPKPAAKPDAFAGLLGSFGSSPSGTPKGPPSPSSTSAQPGGGPNPFSSPTNSSPMMGGAHTATGAPNPMLGSMILSPSSSGASPSSTSGGSGFDPFA